VATQTAPMIKPTRMIQSIWCQMKKGMPSNIGVSPWCHAG